MNSNSNEIEFRRFQDTDLDDVVMVNRTCLPENYAPYFFMEIYYKYPEGFIVAQNIEGSVVGYCMWRVEKSFSHFKVSLRRIKVAHLISIAVLEDYRRKTIGEQLFLNGIAAMRRTHGVQECYLEVRISNDPAIKMYQKHGFEKIKIIQGYYKDGEDANLMAKQLK